MKTLLRIVFCSLLIAGMATEASAQFDPLSSDPLAGDPLAGDQPLVQRFQSPVGNISIGQVWVGANAVNHGLGYDGSYFSGGVIMELGEDILDGWWNLDVRGHLSENGNLFGNFGLVRGVYFDAMKSDLRASIWFDYDDDKAEIFGHSFQQLGASGDVLHEYYELHVNGYFPVGTTTFTLGSPTNCFVGRNFLVQHGIDSALQGADGTIGIRPGCLKPWAGLIDVGTYYFESDLVKSFAGVTAGVSVQPAEGVAFNLQVNHDDRFDTTGYLGVVLYFGGSRGRGVTPGAREAQLTKRNDHIVRVHQDPIFATNPGTGALWVVNHVDNTGTSPTGGDGSVDRPFTTLAAAEAASATDQIILVHEGDGTTTGMDAGITLKDRQLFLADGIAHFVPTVERGSFLLCNDLDGLRPSITHSAGGDVVTLANDNTVAGFIMTPDAMGNNFANGIVGTPGATANVIIRANDILEPLRDGINLTGVPNGGTITITDNIIRYTTAGGGGGGPDSDGIEITNANTATVTIDGNTITSDSLALADDGIQISGSLGMMGPSIDNGVYNINNNVITMMGGHGVEIADPLAGSRVTRGTFNLDRNVITMSALDGINVMNVAGSAPGTPGVLTVTNNTLSMNGDDGLEISNNTLSPMGMPTLLATDRLDATISGNTITSNFDDGIVSAVNDNTGANAITLSTTIRGNTSISANGANGIHVSADTGPGPGTGGATHIVSIRDNPLIAGNATRGLGAGIQLSTDGQSSTTLMTASIVNNTVTGVGINGDFIGNSNLQADISRNVVDGTGASASNGIDLFYALSNTTMNRVVLTSNRVRTHADGVHFDVAGSTQLQIGGPLDMGGNVTNAPMNNTVSDNTGDGFELALSNPLGGAANVRLFLNTNSFLRNGSNGIDLSTLGIVNNATPPVTPAFNVLKATVTNNVINNNMAEGVLAVANFESVIGLELLNNVAEFNALQGARFLVTAMPPGAPPPPPSFNSQMYAIVRDNEFNNNNAGGMFDLVAELAEPGASDMPRICIELTNNMSSRGLFLQDNTAGGVGGNGVFQFEDNGGNVLPVSFDRSTIFKSYSSVPTGTCQTIFDSLNSSFPP